MNFRLPIDRALWRRIFNRMEAETGPVVLDRKRIFILPTRHGLMFSLALLTMLTGSINYNLSLGYVLTFLLGSMALVSILHTFRNMAQLSVRAGKTPAIFASQPAVFTVCLDNPGTLPRHSVGLSHGKQPPEFTEITPGRTSCLHFSVTATRRGLLMSRRPPTRCCWRAAGCPATAWRSG